MVDALDISEGCSKKRDVINIQLRISNARVKKLQQSWNLLELEIQRDAKDMAPYGENVTSIVIVFEQTAFNKRKPNQLIFQFRTCYLTFGLIPYANHLISGISEYRKSTMWGGLLLVRGSNDVEAV